MARTSYLASIALLSLIGCVGNAGNAVAADAQSDGCAACHSDSAFFVKNRKLHNYYQDWLKSPHATSGLSCSNCHGGDPSAADFDTAHAEVRHLNDPASTLYYKNQPGTCGACHGEKVEQFQHSKHYKALVSDTLAPTCTTCHRAMNRRPDFRDIVEDACQTCHNEENADRVPPVADKASEYLQRLNIAKGYLGWTSSYYESHGWPENTKTEIAVISAKYDEAVTRVHHFDLAAMDESSNEIFVELKLMFQKAWQERQDQETQGED